MAMPPNNQLTPHMRALLSNNGPVVAGTTHGVSQCLGSVRIWQPNARHSDTRQ
jgi:hypothetical protein